MDRELKALDGCELAISGDRERGYTHLPTVQTARFEPRLSDIVLVMLNRVLGQYGACGWQMLVKTAYATLPMRMVLAEEARGKSMLNRPMDIEALCNLDPLWRYQKRARGMSFSDSGSVSDGIADQLATYGATRRLRRRATTAALHDPD